MVILEERAASKEDKTFRSAKAGLKKTKPEKVTKLVKTDQVSPPSKAVRTLKTSSHFAYLARIPKAGRNISNILECWELLYGVCPCNKMT